MFSYRRFKIEGKPLFLLPKLSEWYKVLSYPRSHLTVGGPHAPDSIGSVSYPGHRGIFLCRDIRMPIRSRSRKRRLMYGGYQSGFEHGKQMSAKLLGYIIRPMRGPPNRLGGSIALLFRQSGKPSKFRASLRSRRSSLCGRDRMGLNLRRYRRSSNAFRLQRRTAILLG
jgi:hypothetical protein